MLGEICSTKSPLFAHLVARTGLIVHSLLSTICVVDFKSSLLPLHSSICSYLMRVVLLVCTVTKHIGSVHWFCFGMSLVRTKCCIISNVLRCLRKVWIDVLSLASLSFNYPLTCWCWLWQCWRKSLQWFWRRCGDKQVWKAASLKNGPINRFKCALSGAEHFRMPGVSWTYIPNTCSSISPGHRSWSITPLQRVILIFRYAPVSHSLCL